MVSKMRGGCISLQCVGAKKGSVSVFFDGH